MIDRCMRTDSNRCDSGDTAVVTTRGVLSHTPINHVAFSYDTLAYKLYITLGVNYLISAKNILVQAFCPKYISWPSCSFKIK